MINPYKNCPIFESENYLLRLTAPPDAPDLFLVYSDKKAVPYFNSDNCFGDFYCELPEYVENMIKFWLMEYKEKRFVRWSIIDKNINRSIGTIELFNRKADDYFNNCGLLRLDLRSDYECEENIFEILSLITQPAFELFNCEMIATKIPPFAVERKNAAERLNFKESNEKLIGGDDKKEYTDYYVLHI